MEIRSIFIHVLSHETIVCPLRLRCRSLVLRQEQIDEARVLEFRQTAEDGHALAVRGIGMTRDVQETADELAVRKEHDPLLRPLLDALQDKRCARDEIVEGLRPCAVAVTRILLLPIRLDPGQPLRAPRAPATRR